MELKIKDLKITLQIFFIIFFMGAHDRPTSAMLYKKNI